MNPAANVLFLAFRAILLLSVASFRMWLLVADVARSLRPKRLSRSG
jgi:hypothetical protein